MDPRGPEAPARVVGALPALRARAARSSSLMTAASVATARAAGGQDRSLDPLKRAPTAKLRTDTITRGGAPARRRRSCSSARTAATGWKRGESRSDTMMLLRLDPDQEAIGGALGPARPRRRHPRPRPREDQRGLHARRADLTHATIKQLLGLEDQPRRSTSTSAASATAVNALGCVYADVDRRYYHSNAGLPPSDAVRRDRHPARLPAAVRPEGARLRALPPRRHGPRARRAPAGLPAPRQGPGRHERA